MVRQLNEKRLLEGFFASERITRQHAKTFYFASKFLNNDKRFASYSIYAICRFSDEAVDATDKSLTRQALENISRSIECAYSDCDTQDAIIIAFRQTVTKYNIPKHYFDRLLEGMHMDESINRYETFKELYGYCYRVAGVVGLIMLKIFGTEDLSSEQFALDLGIGMQLTNILRDIKEDLLRGRIYLPQDEMRNFNVSENSLINNIIDENFKSLMKFQISRARQYYKDSQAGIAMISDKKARRAVYAMSRMYATILDKIEKNDYDVFSRRAHIKTLAKLFIVFKMLAKGELL